MIQYSLESAVLGRVEEIIIVVGYQAETIINTVGIRYKTTKIRYVLQKELNGLVNALARAQEAVAGENFMLFLADEILFDSHSFGMMKIFRDENLFAVCGVTMVKDVNEIKKTYAVLYNPLNNRIYRLIEKPRKPVNCFMGTGNCIFKNRIFEYIPRTPVNPLREEKELPDLIQCAIDDGNPVKLYPVGSHYVNVNTVDDIKIAEKMFKKDRHPWKKLIAV